MTTSRSFHLFPTLVALHEQVLTPDELALIRQHCMNAEAGPHGALVGQSKSSFAKQKRFLEELQAQHPGQIGRAHV